MASTSTPKNVAALGRDSFRTSLDELVELVAEESFEEATGRCEVRPNAMVLEIHHDAAGKVNGVLYADRDGQHHQQKARIVCVAGNSIETPRLLLNSASSQFPDGLANGSGQVGKNFLTHTEAGVFASFDQPVNCHRGRQAAGAVWDEAHFKPERGFVGGYYMLVFHMGLYGLAAALGRLQHWQQPLLTAGRDVRRVLRGAMAHLRLRRLSVWTRGRPAYGPGRRRHSYLYRRHGLSEVTSALYRLCLGQGGRTCGGPRDGP